MHAPAYGARHWDGVAEAWPTGAAPLWRRQSDSANAALLDRWLPPGAGRLLKTDLFDEFAGAGLHRLLESRCDAVVGVDCAPLVVAGARRRHPGLRAEIADVRALPFADASFDAVFSPSTLDHFDGRESMAAALAELARVLRPGGRLIVTLDNPWNPLVAARNALPPRAAARLRRVPYAAGWTCGPRLLRRMLKRAGLSVRDATAILHIPRVLVAELDRLGNPFDDSRGWERAFAASERAGRWPTRYLTGHFVAALATRR